MYRDPVYCFFFFFCFFFSGINFEFEAQNGEVETKTIDLLNLTPE